MFERLTSQFPDCDPTHLAALAAVWTSEGELILSRMFEISRASDRRLPIEIRHEVAFELAKLVLWLEDRMVEAKTSTVPIGQIEPEAESAAIAGATGRQRIENTARIIASSIWSPLCAKWWRQCPAIPTAPPPTRIVGLASTSAGVKNQHFSPVFSNRNWAGANGAVRVYTIGIDGRVAAKRTGYRKWGQEASIYSQALERHFGLIEADAKIPYQKLLDVIPFGEADRRHWVAFVAAQMFRTPFFLVQSLAGLQRVIAEEGLLYPSDLASLRRAHESLFTDSDVFTMVYRLLVGRKWKIWAAPACSQFVRSDHPVLIGTTGATATVFYPISSEKCFVAGPELAGEVAEIVPEQRTATDVERAHVNSLSASVARRSLLASVRTDDSSLRAEIGPTFGRQWLAFSRVGRSLPEHWGPLA